MSGRRWFALVLVAGAALTVAGSAASHSATSGCAHWAAPNGDDAGPGSQIAPYQTIAHLLSTLRPGQDGCLAAGGVFSEHVVVSVSGRAGAPITLMSTPNAQGAVLQGGVEFAPSSHDVQIEHVAVRTTATNRLSALVVLRGLRNALLDSNVQGAAAAPANESCVLLDHANRARLDHDAIEQCGHLPDASGYVPGIDDSVSTAARITNNVIRLNPSDGIALAPDAQLTFVSRNLIINNGGGVLFGGGDKFASTQNQVTHNVIASSATYNVHASYANGAPTGVQNVVSGNCLWRGGQGNVAGMLPDGRGFKTVGNVAAPPTAKSCKSDLPSRAPLATPTNPATKQTVRLVSPDGLRLTAAAAVTGGSVKLITVAVHGAVAGATVTLGCVSGCKLVETLRAGATGAATSKAFANQTVPEGAVLEARATKSGYTGAFADFVVRPNVAAGLIFHIQATGCLQGARKVGCPKPGK